MMGSVTRRSLKYGTFPWCLNQTFARERSACVFKSPYSRYIHRQKVLVSVVVLALVAGFLAMIGLAAGYSSGERSLIFDLAVWGSLVIGATSVVGLLIYLFSYKGIENSRDDLKGFESKLDDVLRFPFRGDRPVHLMTAGEISAEASEVLNTLALEVLRSEQVSSWSSEAEERRKKFKNAFELFKFYGLIAEREVYGPFFAEAEKRMTTPLEKPPATQLEKPPAFKDPNWATFDEALQFLNLREDELKRLTSEAEFCAFRDGDDGLKFRREDIENLKENLKRRQEEKIAPFSPAEGK